MKGNDFLDYSGLEKYHDRLTSVLEDKFTWVKNYVDREINNIPEPEISEVPELEPVLNVDRIKYESVDGALIYPNNTDFGDSYYIESEDYGYIYYGGPITEIPNNAFFEQAALQKLYIPVGVTQIGDYAFSGCYSLTDVTIPDGVSNIEDGAFLDTSLKTVTIPNSVTHISQGAFYGCRSLLHVTLSESLANINYLTFAQCSSLASIIIPNSVASIGDSAFYRCPSLTSVTIGNSVTSIGGSAFYDCFSLTSVIIGNSVTSIGDWAFGYCYSLTSITIPNNVTSIGGCAFYDCYRLTSVTCLCTTPPTLGGNALPDSITHIFVPRHTVDQYKNDTSWGLHKDIIFPIEDELSENTVNYLEFNNKMYSLKLGYDSNNKLEIQVVKDLAYALTLSASPTSVWYGSDYTITFTVRANDYTRDAKGWTFQATGDSLPTSYAALSQSGTQNISKAYSTVKANITGTLTVDTSTSTTIQCYIPILYSLTQFTDESSYTSFSSTTNLIGKLYVTNGSYSFDSITPSNDLTTLYVAIPGEIDSIKYLAENTSNKTPSIGTITLKINGQNVTYSIFEPCGTVPGATFKLYE